MDANNESSEVCGIIKPGRRVKLNRLQAVNVHKLLTIRSLGIRGSHRMTAFVLDNVCMCDKEIPREYDKYCNSIFSWRQC